MKSKKGVIAIVAVAVLTVAAVVGILIKKDYGSYRYNSELYFFNETATSIVMENREIKYKDDKELAESVIEALTTWTSFHLTLLPTAVKRKNSCRICRAATRECSF